MKKKREKAICIVSINITRERGRENLIKRYIKLTHDSFVVWGYCFIY